MPVFPAPVRDVFQGANKALKTASNFIDNNLSSPSIPGFTAAPIPAIGSNPSDRLLPANRSAVFARNMMRWFVPEIGVIEMYVNPQGITYQDKKHITQQRTKGGYVLQYWGEELGTLAVSGTTGSSGVEGINVLDDIYRSEQLAFDPYALALASDRNSSNNDQLSFLGDLSDSFGGLLQGGESFSNLVANSIETGSSASTRSQPSLAELAFSMELYWSGWVFRGYFNDFRVEEKADKLGLFDYFFNFTVTQRRGVRSNFLAWHRQPNGPSNTDPIAGRPYSFTSLSTEQASPIGRQNVENGLSASEVLKSLSPITNVVTSFSSIF